MDVFIVKKWQGEIKPDNEVEEIRWLISQIPKDIKVGSIMEHETIPKLKAEDFYRLAGRLRLRNDSFVGTSRYHLVVMGCLSVVTTAS